MQNIAVYVNRYLPPTETFIYNRIKNFTRFNPQVICHQLDYPDYFHLDRIHAYTREKRTFQTLRHYIYQTLKKNNIRLLHVHFSVNGFVCLGPARKAGIPLVTFFHGSDVYLFKDIFFKLRLRHLLRTGDYFVVPCQDMKNNLLKMGGIESRIKVIYEGIDLKQFQIADWAHRDAQQTYTLLMIGRLIDVKGFIYGIEAFKLFYDKHKTGILNIIGDGELKPQLQQAAAEYPINFLGFLSQDEVARHVRASDLVVVPSIFSKYGNPDNCPTTVKEAMACSVPVIGSRLAGIPEMICDEVNGLLFEQKNIPQIAQDMEYFFLNPDTRMRYGKEGRRIAIEKFEVHKQMRILETLYEDILAATD